MTAEELEQIRGRHRRVAEAVPEVPLSDHGLVAHADRYALLAEAVNLTAELAAARGEVERLREALIEISVGAGPFSRNQLTFAGNCIHAMKNIAREALGVDPLEPLAGDVGEGK